MSIKYWQGTHYYKIGDVDIPGVYDEAVVSEHTKYYVFFVTDGFEIQQSKRFKYEEDAMEMLYTWIQENTGKDIRPKINRR